MTVLRAGGATDVGKVRSNNQDAFAVGDRLCVVCDGVGGHQGGEVASATAVEAIQGNFTDGTLDGLLAAIEAANRAVWDRAQTDTALRGMGTTVTAVAVVEEGGEERLAVANVGDSRAYLLQHGELSQLTEDHSLVEQMYREGRISRAEADVHPQKSLITRALGLDDDVEIDSWQILPDGVERVLLCSDGLTNEVTDDRIASILRRLADPAEAARELVRVANDAGGRDNVTVVVVDVAGGDGAGAASAALAGEPSGLRGRAEPVEEGGGRPAGRRRRTEAAGPRTRRVTWRVAVFLVVLLAVLGAAGAAVGWYARRTYHVGLEGDTVAIFKGRPGGLLWFDPTVERRTDLDVDDIPESRRDDVAGGHETSDLEAAERYVANLEDEADATRTFATTPTSAPLTVAPTTVSPTTVLPPP